MPQDKSSLLMWAGSILLAIVIIGGAVMISKNRADTSSEIPAPSEIAEIAPVQTPRPSAGPPPQAEAVEPSAPAQAPAPASPVEPAIPADPLALDLGNLAGTLKLALPALTEGNDRLPLEHTCYRSNTTPALAWSGAPAGTKSYVLFMEQRKPGEAPYLYWVLFNIPAAAQGLEKGLSQGPELPDGARYGRSQHGVVQYTGPCDPKGQMKYAMRLFALNTVLDVAAGAGREELIPAMNGHIIDMAEVPFIHFMRL